MKKLLVAAIPMLLLAFSTTAMAARQPDLNVSLDAPSVHVYETGTYTATVANNGNRNANSVVLAIMLPETATSPQVHVMGDLSSWSNSCSLDDTALICSLGRIRKGKSKSVSFDLALPRSADALVFSLDASSNRADGNPADDSLSFTATPQTFDTAVNGPLSVTNRHCTGQNLSSFYECSLYPSSTHMFLSILEDGGNIQITAPQLPPGYAGSWTQTGADSIYLEYSYNGQVTGWMDAYGVGGGCFEGVMHFPNPAYVAVYEICP